MGRVWSWGGTTTIFVAHLSGVLLRGGWNMRSSRMIFFSWLISNSSILPADLFAFFPFLVSARGANSCANIPLSHVGVCGRKRRRLWLQLRRPLGVRIPARSQETVSSLHTALSPLLDYLWYKLFWFAKSCFHIAIVLALLPPLTPSSLFFFPPFPLSPSLSCSSVSCIDSLCNNIPLPDLTLSCKQPTNDTRR